MLSLILIQTLTCIAHSLVHHMHFGIHQIIGCLATAVAIIFTEL